MAAPRLNSFIREQIQQSVLDSRFKTPKQAVRNKLETLADEVYHDVYPPKLLGVMKGLPNGFLPTSGRLLVAFGSGADTVSVNWAGNDRRVADKHKGWSTVAKIYPDTHEFSERYKAFSQELDQLEVDEKTAKAGIKSVLDSVTTIKRLLQVWPEVEPFARPFMDEHPTKALAPPIKDLNSRLGLPPETQK